MSNIQRCSIQRINLQSVRKDKQCLFSLYTSLRKELSTSLREKCPNTEYFLFRFLLYSDWIRTRKNSVLGHFSRSACVNLSYWQNYIFLSFSRRIWNLISFNDFPALFCFLLFLWFFFFGFYRIYYSSGIFFYLRVRYSK